MGKYDALASFLKDSARSQGTVTLSFAQVEDVMRKPLPMSAAKFRSWWGNDGYHVQSVAWRASGWRVYRADLPRKVVTFIRDS